MHSMVNPQHLYLLVSYVLAGKAVVWLNRFALSHNFYHEWSCIQPMLRLFSGYKVPCWAQSPMQPHRNRNLKTAELLRCRICSLLSLLDCISYRRKIWFIAVYYEHFSLVPLLTAGLVQPKGHTRSKYPHCVCVCVIG